MQDPVFEPVICESLEEARAAMRTSHCSACGAPLEMVIETVRHDTETGAPVQMYLARCSRANGLLSRAVMLGDFDREHDSIDYGYVRR